MSFDATGVRQRLYSHLAANGRINQVLRAEFVAPPPNGFNASLIQSRIDVAEVTLATTVERHEITVRIYGPMGFQADTDQVTEDRLANVVADVLQDIAENFQLGGGIRAVDIAGQYGGALSAQWGYTTLNQDVYRVCDITVPFIVDSNVDALAA